MTPEKRRVCESGLRCSFALSSHLRRGRRFFFDFGSRRTRLQPEASLLSSQTLVCKQRSGAVCLRLALACLSAAFGVGWLDLCQHRLEFIFISAFTACIDCTQPNFRSLLRRGGGGRMRQGVQTPTANSAASPSTPSAVPLTTLSLFAFAFPPRHRRHRRRGVGFLKEPFFTRPKTLPRAQRAGVLRCMRSSPSRLRVLPAFLGSSPFAAGVATASRVLPRVCSSPGVQTTRRKSATARKVRKRRRRQKERKYRRKSKAARPGVLLLSETDRQSCTVLLAGPVAPARRVRFSEESEFSLAEKKGDEDAAQKTSAAPLPPSKSACMHGLAKVERIFASFANSAAVVLVE